jgi:hypothetical protein
MSGLILMRDLLAENGGIRLHCDWRVNRYLIDAFRQYQ